MITNKILPTAEFCRKAWSVMLHFTTGGGLLWKFRLHREVKTELKPFKINGLIRSRAYYVYILPYVSKSIPVAQKQEIIINHYRFTKEKFTGNNLFKLFKSGIICYCETYGKNDYNILLKAVTDHLEFEGSMSLQFRLGNKVLYTLSFTFLPGRFVNTGNGQIIFISSVQGTKAEYDHIRKATKHFSDISIPVILMTVLETVALLMDIQQCAGISAEYQVSYKNGLNFERFFATYDQFWLNTGGIYTGQHYLIDLPLRHKPLTEIDQHHRKRTLKKRKKLQEISAEVFQAFSTNFNYDEEEVIQKNTAPIYS